MGIDLPGWLAERLERTYGEGNRAGKGIRPALEGLTAAEAHWRPVPAQHTIAEIAWHMAYWCWKVAHWLDPDAVTDPGEEGGQPLAPTPGAWLQVRLGPARPALRRNWPWSPTSPRTPPTTPPRSSPCAAGPRRRRAPDALARAVAGAGVRRRQGESPGITQKVEG